jgi:hypothetical protein
MLALGVGLAIVVGMGLVLYYFGLSQLEAGVVGIALFAAACIGIVLGAALVVMAAGDWGRGRGDPSSGCAHSATRTRSCATTTPWTTVPRSGSEPCVPVESSTSAARRERRSQCD